MNSPLPRAGAAVLRLAAVAAAVLAAPAGAQPAADAAGGGGAPAAALQPVTVTATRVATPAFDVPASIDRIGAETIRDGHAQVNISESLGGVPGVQVRDRQNYAQDVQLSIRGFGARSSFGIRGVRLYVDDIPATFPDGQGQITNVDLGSVDRIEVLRGPFSALYGNSAGGVISVYTEDGAARPALDFNVESGSYGGLRLGTKLSGRSGEGAGSFDYVLSGSRFRTDGYRDHSAATRTIGNVKLGMRLDDASTLTLIGNALTLPQAQDPLGLSRASPSLETDPRAVDPSALAFDTRKSVEQTQAGLVYERRLGAADSVRVLVYDGHRGTQQFQSIPVATQTATPQHPGGVIALSSGYSGTDLRWTRRGELAGGAWSVVAGVAYDRVDQHRQGYLNFTGSAAARVLGVQGALRRDEDDVASNLDEYLQAEWHPHPAWTVSAGVRHTRVQVDSTDRFITAGNGDDSGAARYAATLPVFAVMFAANESVHFYATAGRGVETPTLNELAYRPDAAPGLNFGLQPARSRSLEAGVKLRLDRYGELDLAVFDTRTDDEIVTLTNTGGRATYQNAGGTRRSGLELGWRKDLAENLRAQVALGHVDAVYRDAFSTCNKTPCPAASQTPVPAGNAIPGVARDTGFAALVWAPPLGWQAGVEGRASARVNVDDANSDAAAGYAVLGAHLGYAVAYGPWRFTGLLRGDNLLDRRYVGSVIVNEGNGRFFEPAPGRTWLAAIGATLTFP